MKWAVLAVLALVFAWVFVPDAPQGPGVQPDARALAKPRPQMPAPMAQKTGDGPARRMEKVGSQTCEVFATQGAHVALTVEEARSGAAEDVRDVCPSNVVTQVLEKCSEQQTPNADGVLERQYRCVQSGNCRVCGEHLARRNEVLDEGNK